MGVCGCVMRGQWKEPEERIVRSSCSSHQKSGWEKIAADLGILWEVVKPDRGWEGVRNEHTGG